MSKHVLGISFLSLLMVGTLGACHRLAPIQNPVDVGMASAVTPTPTQFAQIIARAGAQHGWAVDHAAKGRTILTLNKRSYRVKVEVRYSGRGAQIRYLRSEGLGYDGTMIHTNYNRWMRNLRVAISRGLAYLPPTAPVAAPPRQPAGGSAAGAAAHTPEVVE